MSQQKAAAKINSKIVLLQELGREKMLYFSLTKRQNIDVFMPPPHTHTNPGIRCDSMGEQY